MTKEKVQTSIADLARQAQAIFQPNGGATPQFEKFLTTQESALREIESFAQHWLERRQEATRNAADALRKMNSTDRSDPTATLQAITEWQRGSFDRLRADLQEWTALCMRCAVAATTAQRETASADASQGDAGKANSKAKPGTDQDEAGRTNSKSSPRSTSAVDATPV